MKNKVRLTESDLHRIIKESVRRILNESDLPETTNSVHKVSMNGVVVEYMGRNKILKATLNGKELTKGHYIVYDEHDANAPIDTHDRGVQIVDKNCDLVIEFIENDGWQNYHDVFKK